MTEQAASPAPSVLTADIVFDPNPNPNRISDDAFTVIRNTVARFQIPKEESGRVREMYVDILNSPAVAARRLAGEDVWVRAARMLQAKLVDATFGSKAIPFLVFPLSISGKAVSRTDDKGVKSFSARMFGLARSLDPKVTFEGPSGISLYGYASEADAQRVIDTIRARGYYHTDLRISSKSPTGVLGKGQVGILNGTAPAFVPVPNENGHGWGADPYARLLQTYVPSTAKEALTSAKDYEEFLLDLTVVRGNVNAKKESSSAVLTVIDDSISGDPALLEKTRGGMSIWLSRDDFPLARLQTGSQVRAVVSAGKEKPVMDKTGKATGEVSRMYSANAVWVVFDVGGGAGGMPHPDEVIGRLPGNGSAPSTRDF